MEKTMIDGILMGVGVTGTTAAAFAWLARLVYRRVVKDGLETVKDRAEADYVSGVVLENKVLRDRHDAMAEKYVVAMRELGELAGTVVAQTATITRLENEIAQLRQVVEGQQGRIDRLLQFVEALSPPH